MAISSVTNNDLSPDNAFADYVSGSVPRKNAFYKFARTTEEEIEDTAQQNMEEVVQEVDETNGLYDSMMAVRAFLDGQTLGFAGEANSAVSSVVLKTFWPDLFQDKTVADLRQEIITETEEEQFKWAEQNPKLSIGLNVAGGILSPANAVGVGIVNKAQQANQARKAAQSAQGVQQALTGVATSGRVAPAALGASEQAAARSLQTAQQYSGMSPAMFNVLSRTPTLAVATGVGATEGAIAGAGFAPQGQKVEGAITGAAFGAAAPIALKGAGLLANSVTKSRIAQPLGKGKDFVSIMFTESGVSGFYRTILSKTFAGKSLLEQQARNTAGKVLVKAGEANTKLQATTARTSQAISSLKRNIKKNAGTETAKLLAKKDDEILKLQREAGDAHADLVATANKEKEELKLSMVGSEADSKAALLRDIDASTNADGALFRSVSRMEGMPSLATKAEREAIQELDPQDALIYLDEVWKNKGFGAAKKKSFNINTTGVVGSIQAILEKDTKAYLALKQSTSPTLAQDIVQRTLAKEVKDGKISGEALVNLRSEVGIILNSITENKALVRDAVDEIQNYLDDIITKQLTPKQRTSFESDKFKYATKNVIENATYKATGRKGSVEGAYTADDWIAANKQANKYFSARGKSPLQKEAAQLSANMKQRDELLKGEADSIVRERVKTNIKDAGIARAELAKQQDVINKVRDLEIRDVKRSYAESTKTVSDRAALDARLAEVKSKHSAQSNLLKEQQKQLTDQISFLREASPKRQVSFFEQDYSATTIGRLATNTSFGLKTQLIGNLSSFGLASEKAQRAFTGQTAWQESAQQTLKQLDEARQVAARMNVDVTTLGTISAGQATADTEPMFSPPAKAAVLRGGQKRMKAVYEGLKNRGHLERLKTQDRDLYEKLKAAAGE